MPHTRNVPDLPRLFKAMEISASSPELLEVLGKCTPEDQAVILTALRDAYEAGTEESDQRTGRLMARIFGGFVGVTPGIDINQPGKQSSGGVMRGMVRLLANATTTDK